MNAIVEESLATALRVREALDSDGRAWADYAASHPDATVFHRWEWREILHRAFGFRPRYLLALRAGQIVGLLPLMEVRTLLFGHALTSLPFCSWAGPIGSDMSALQALDDHAIGLASTLGVDHLEYRSIGPATRDWPTQDLYVLFRKPIVADHEANMNAIPRKQRAMVRKGIKNALTSGPDSVDGFHRMYADNVHRHGTPACPRRFFSAMAEAFGEDLEILTVRDPSGTPVSTVLSLFYRDEVFPFYAGDHPAARDLAANDFKYWEVMRRAADAGYRSFNYGRSKRGTGSFDFKKNWGFEPEPLAYQYWLPSGGPIPQNNPNNPKYRLLIETWRKLPASLVGALGPLVVKGLG